MTERADSKLSRFCEDSRGSLFYFVFFCLLLQPSAAAAAAGICETTTPFCPFYRKSAARLTNHTLQ